MRGGVADLMRLVHERCDRTRIAAGGRSLPVLPLSQAYSCVNTTRWKSPARTEHSRHMMLPDGSARSMS